MKISDLFSGKHADYYAEQALGLGSSGAFVSLSQLLEILGILHNRIGALESQVEGLETKVKELEKQLKKRL